MDYEEALTILQRMEQRSKNPSPPQAVSVVRAEITDPTPMPNAVSGEEYVAEIHMDDVEAEILSEDPPVSLEDHDPDGCDECLAAEAADEEPLPEPEPEVPPPPPRPPRRFEVRVNADAFKVFVARIGNLADDGRVYVSRDGLQCRVVDPAHVAMIDVTLRDDDIGYEVVDGKNVLIDPPIEVGFNFDVLKGLLKKAKNGVTVPIGMDLPDEKDRDRLTVTVGGVTRTTAAIDTAGITDPKIPALDLPGYAKLPAKALLDALTAVSEVTDHVELVLMRDGLGVFGEGDVDKVSTVLAADGMEFVLSATIEEKVRSLFPMDYLLSFLKTVKGETLTVHLGDDVPLRAEWDGSARGIYLLAPRIETP